MKIFAAINGLTFITADMFDDIELKFALSRVCFLKIIFSNVILNIYESARSHIAVRISANLIIKNCENKLLL